MFLSIGSCAVQSPLQNLQADRDAILQKRTAFPPEDIQTVGAALVLCNRIAIRFNALLVSHASVILSLDL